MEMIGRLWQDPRVAFTVLGSASGVAGTFAYKYMWISNVTDIVYPGTVWEVAVGVIFGAAMGVALVWRGQATVRKATLFMLLATLSWLVAHRFGVLVPQHDFGFLVLYSAVGILLGLVGAGGVAGSLAWLFPLYRHRRAWLTITGVGAAFGALLSVAWGMAFFVLWQAAVGLAIAWPLWRSVQDSANKSG